MDERFLKRLLAVSPVVIYSLLPRDDFATVYISDAVERVLGYSPRNFLDDFCFGEKLVHSEDVARYRTGFAQAVRDGASALECRMRIHNGSYRWFRHELNLIRDEHERPVEVVGCMVDVTREKQVEDQVRRKTELLELAQRASGNGIWDWDIRTGEVWLSPRYKEMLGYSDDELPSDPTAWDRLADPEDRERALRLMDECLEGRTPLFEATVRLRHKDGSFRHILDRAIVKRDTDGTPIRMVGVHMDLTQRLQAAERLRRSEERFRDFAGAASDWLWEMGADLRITYLSEPFAKVLGLSASEIIGMTMGDFTKEDMTAPKWRALREDIRNRRPFRDFECQAEWKGQARHLRVNGKPMLAADGTFQGYRGTTTDITTIKLQEEALRRRERELSRAQEIARMGDWRWHVCGDAIEWSDGLYAIMRTTRQEYMSCLSDYMRRIHHEDREAVGAALKRVVVEKSTDAIEHRIRVCDDTERVFRVDGRCELDDAGEVVAVYGTCQDITEWKQVEAALREGEARLRLALDAARLGTLELDLETGKAAVSERTTAIYGISPEAMTQDAWLAMVHPEDRETLSARWVSLSTGTMTDTHDEFRIRRPDGQTQSVAASLSVLRDARGAPVRLVGVVQDITER
ncbi:MAG TPA: PAS domain-containing protein, partial [Alphaproteobacteria bacterium]|nr:PAS domain-containing protein [Alphaproteobacteria bacterium]